MYQIQSKKSKKKCKKVDNREATYDNLQKLPAAKGIRPDRPRARAGGGLSFSFFKSAESVRISIDNKN